MIRWGSEIPRDQAPGLARYLASVLPPRAEAEAGISSQAR